VQTINTNYSHPQLTLITDQDLKRVLIYFEKDNIEEDVKETWDEKLEHAQIISPWQTPPDLVTMHSTLECSEIGTLTVVFPHEADISKGYISILTPLGISLLGCRRGDIVTWKSRHGFDKKIVVDALTYQPESAGHWHR
jgi:regulator of nucleoside diphosphate kinase